MSCNKRGGVIFASFECDANRIAHAGGTAQFGPLRYEHTLTCIDMTMLLLREGQVS